MSDAIIEVTGNVITSVEPAGGHHAPEPAGTIWPGLIDLHCHGGGGHTLCTTDPQEALAAAEHHAMRGTTSVMGSLVTAPADTLLAQVRALAPLVTDGHLLGLHLEGPFLSPARRGAQDPRWLLDPDPGLTERLLAAADGTIKVVTIAPELHGASHVIAMLRDAGVTVALGHTDASYDVMRAAIDELEGAALVTHLANGMPPLHHRAAGPAGAALVAAARGEASVELIADGVHVDRGFTALTFAAAEQGKVALITDSMAAAGMPDGEYDLGPQRVRVEAGVARLTTGGDALAGGTSHLADDVTRAARATAEPRAASGPGAQPDTAGRPAADRPATCPDTAGHPAPDPGPALAAATSTPARILGLGQTLGLIAPGARANLLVHAPDGTLSVMRNGAWLTERPAGRRPSR
jgi:N-acetylglucosamine-6-phosphate deacetylase